MVVELTMKKFNQETTSARNKVKLEIAEDSLAEEHGPVSKRSKQQHHGGEVSIFRFLSLFCLVLDNVNCWILNVLILAMEWRWKWLDGGCVSDPSFTVQSAG